MPGLVGCVQWSPAAHGALDSGATIRSARGGEGSIMHGTIPACVDTQCESPSLETRFVMQGSFPHLYFFQDFRFGLVGCKGRYSPNPTIFLIQRDFIYFFVWFG